MAANACSRLERSAEETNHGGRARGYQRLHSSWTLSREDRSRRESTWMPTFAVVLNAQLRRQITVGEHVEANACAGLERSAEETNHEGEHVAADACSCLGRSAEKTDHGGRPRGSQRLQSS